MKKTAGLMFIVLSIGEGTAFASLVDEGLVTFTGTGLGNVPTILTVQANGNATTETGCVGWNGSINVIGDCAIQGGSTFTGGNEKTGASQTLTELVSAAAPLNGFSGSISSYGNLALVVNADQPAGTSIDLTQLIMTVYSASGGVQGSVSASCPAGGCILNPTLNGIGQSGYVFQVSSDEVASLGAFSSGARIGVATTFTDAAGGPETIWLGSGPTLTTGGGVPGGGQVPEPGTIGMLAAGLIGIVALRRRRA